MTTVDFVANRRPPLLAGVYTVTAEQTVMSVDGLRVPPTNFAAAPTDVVVAGPRRALAPAAVLGVYPPAGSSADHATVLPHVRLDPPTLPWQRSARAPEPGDDTATRSLIAETPWLALLLFDADEAPELQTVPAGQLDAATAAWWPPPPEPGEADDDPVAVVDVPRRLLGRLLPTIDELHLLTHVRERTDDTGARHAAAVVLGARLPPPGRTSTAHLVSIEHLAHRDPGWRYRFEALDDDATVRLVSLHHWSFTSAAPHRSFQGLAAALDTTPLTLRLATETGLRSRVSCTPDGTVVHTDERGAVADTAGAPDVTVVSSGAFGPALRVSADRPGDARMPRPLTDAEAFTIATWVAPTDAEPGAFLPIIAPQDLTEGPSMWQTPTGGVALANQRDDTPVLDTHEGVLATAGAWVHLAWVRRGGQQRLFVNGVASDARPAPPLVATSADLWVGRTGLVVPRARPDFEGLLADVRVYDRALDDDEVAALRDADRTHQPELAGAFTSRGLVPVEHRLRHGGRAASWIRSPLSIDPAARPRQPAPGHADGWLDAHVDVGMLDVTLAAAWELGRQVMLASRTAATALHRWRRATQQAVHRDRHAARAPHLATVDPHDDVDPARLPAPVESLLVDLATLRRVPVSYLVPDPALLPPESLRIVRVDPIWVDAARRGALSIGVQSSGDRVREDDLLALLPSTPERWGFLLRSELVADWPSLVVALDGAPLSDLGVESAAPLDVVRQEEIAPGVLLVLVEGVPRTVQLHLAPEEIHCGLDVADDDGALRLPLRDDRGHLTDVAVDRVPLRPTAAGPGDRRVVDVSGLRSAIQARRGGAMPSPADMAVQLVAGVPQARFVIGPEEGT